MRAHPALIGLAASAALTGCAATATTGAPTAPTRTPSVSVSAVPTPVITIATPKATSAAPALKNTGTSWMPILTSLSAYGQWLLANPNPALVGNIATPGCAVANMLTEQINGLLGSGAYVRTAPAVITNVLGPSSTAGTPAVMEVIASRPAESVLSLAKGNRIGTFAAYPQSTLQVTLDLGADKRWRFCSVEAATDEGATGGPSVPLI